MSLYFSAAVWASLALCVFYSLGDHLPRHRTVAAAYCSGACGVPQAATDHRDSRNASAALWVRAD
jgi:hypothetical protein